MKRPKEKLARSKGKIVPYDTPLLEATEQKGDLLIRDLWLNETDSVHKMRVVNTDAKSHLAKNSGEVSAGGGADKEEDVAGGLPPTTSKLISLCCLCRQTDRCGDDGYSEIDSQLPWNKVASTLLTDVRIFKSRVPITLVRATHRCIWESRVTAHKISV